MAQGPSDYDRGTVGAEIAYTIGTEKLDLKNLIMNEPSKGGTDLIVADKTVVMQARLIDIRKVLSVDFRSTIEGQLMDLQGQLGKDFINNPSAHLGYVVLSYIDYDNSIKTIVLEVFRT